MVPPRALMQAYVQGLKTLHQQGRAQGTTRSRAILAKHSSLPSRTIPGPPYSVYLDPTGLHGWQGLAAFGLVPPDGGWVMRRRWRWTWWRFSFLDSPRQERRCDAGPSRTSGKVWPIARTRRERA